MSTFDEDVELVWSMMPDSDDVIVLWQAFAKGMDELGYDITPRAAVFFAHVHHQRRQTPKQLMERVLASNLWPVKRR